MRSLIVSVALVSVGCLPTLEVPPAGTPVSAIEQCAADASAHRLTSIGGAVGGGLGLAGLLTGVAVDNGHNGPTVAAIVTPAAIVGAAGLVIAVLGGEATTLKYLGDGCAFVTGPLPLYKRP